MQVDCSTRRMDVYWEREKDNEWICIYFERWKGEKENQRQKCPPV